MKFLINEQQNEKIIEFKPGQKAIIVSGFSKDNEVKKAMEIGASGFLKKPYSMEQLARAVQKELQDIPE